MSDTTPNDNPGEGSITEGPTAEQAPHSPEGAPKRTGLAETGKQALDHFVARGKHAMDSFTGRSQRHAQTDGSEPKPALDRLQETMREPTTGAAVAGAAVVGAMGIFGIAPTLLGATTGYVIYRSLRERNSQRESERERGREP